jgi:hypothetical protein
MGSSGFLIELKASSHNVALGSTQPLVELSARGSEVILCFHRLPADGSAVPERVGVIPIMKRVL